MAQLLFIADPHFGHTNIIKFCNRPFHNTDEMDNTLIKNWNDKVKKKDTVYLIGDLSWHSAEITNDILSMLHGKIHWIKGNHDHYLLKDKNFNINRFESIKDYDEIKYNKQRIILFHYPIASWNAAFHGSTHIHGHIHNNENEYIILNDHIKQNMYNVSVEMIDYTPITLDELKKHKGKNNNE